MYVKFKQCPRHTAEYPILQNNLRVFNSILKGMIREAKIKHYNKLFNQYQGDIKMTWKTISEIICKSNYEKRDWKDNYWLQGHIRQGRYMYQI